MRAPRDIFREYDVRGLAETELSADLAYHLGRAVGTRIVEAGGKRAVVGRDHRASGPALSNAVVEGMMACGLEVLEIGVTPTPVQYWALVNLDADGGLQVTGSHNPPEYNGFKITLRSGPMFGEEIRALHATIENEAYISGDGSRSSRDVMPDYLADLAGRLKGPTRGFTVVVDAGNGTGGLSAVPLLERLGYNVVPLFCEPDSNFPNHHPDPTVEENLEDLKRAVAEHDAQIGLAFDGDADRLGVVDRDGQAIWGDRVLILLARQVLEEVPGAAIIGEVKCSKALYDDIRKHGGQPIMWKAGHSLIKAKMKESGALLAGEMSGHIFFKHRYYGFDDALFAGGRLLEILHQRRATLGELLQDVPELVSTPEIRVPCPEPIKFELVRRAVQAFQDRAEAGGYRVVDIDGARIEFDDGFGLVRPSNTQPILVLRFEAESRERLEEIRHLVEDQLAQVRAELEAGR